MSHEPESQEQQVPALVAQPVVMEAVIQITRAQTGKVEEYTIRGVVPPQEE